MPKDALNELLNAVSAYTSQIPGDTTPENYAYRLGCANGILVAIAKIAGHDLSSASR